MNSFIAKKVYKNIKIGTEGELHTALVHKLIEY